MKREIKVGAIQMKTMPGSSREEKVSHSVSLIEQAAAEGCKIVAASDEIRKRLIELRES